MLRTRNAVVALAAALSLATITAAGTQLPASAHSARKAAQRGTLVVLPQIAAPGSSAQAASSAKTALTATFKPAVKGRTIAIQRKQGSKWVTVARQKQGRTTTFDFAVSYSYRGKAAVYRAIATGAKKSATVTKAYRTSVHGTPDFSEEFKGTSLNSTVWNTRDQGYIGTRGCSKADPRAVRVSGGTLRLSTLKDPDRTAQKCNYKGKKYSYRITGHVGTVTPNLGAGQTPTKSYKYGYFAARMKMHSARGQHAGFWLQTTKSTGAARTHGSEVDIVEYFGDKHPEGGVASYIYPPGKKIGGMIPSVTQYGRDWSKRYHVFSLQWTPSVYIFRIDGKETLRITKNVSQVPEFMILSNLVSDWELPLGSESKLPQTAQVDWVRHWKL